VCLCCCLFSVSVSRIRPAKPQKPQSHTQPPARALRPQRKLSTVPRRGQPIIGPAWSMGDVVDASEMSISELRRALESRGIDYRDCIEKAELVERLTRDRRDEDAVARSVIMDDRRSSSEGNVESGGRLALPEKRLIALFERCGPSVAFIATSVAQQRGTSQLSLSVEQVPAGTGSGFVWDSAGHIVTNYHVVKDVINVGQAHVTLGRGTRALSASLVGVEPEKDIAVLKVEVAESGTDLVPIAIGSSAGLQVGQSVAAIGCAGICVQFRRARA
jgi:S1-C subfamily serine protease